MNLEIAFSFFVFNVGIAFSQGHSYRYYDKSSMSHESDSAQLDFSFFTADKKVFRDDLRIYAIKNSDTTRLTTDFSGKTFFQLSPGQYSFMICSQFMDSFVVPEINLQCYRVYYFDFYFQTKTIRLPEMRYDLGKPVIYCYNDEADEEISIKLKCNGEIRFTYPEYNNEWHFRADSAGTISYEDTSLPYLFWDAKNVEVSYYFESGYGFQVEKNQLIEFFDSVLTVINFNAQERADFIVYWVPQMIRYDAVDVHFLINENCDELAVFDVKPLPDELFRVYMIWRPSATRCNRPGAVVLIPQNLPSMDRKGFTILEWGGMMINDRPGK